jgi:hypothetical protein
MLLERAGLTLAVAALLVGACGGTAVERPAVPSYRSVPSPGLPVPSVSTDPQDPPPSGYAEPCHRVAVLAAWWGALAVRIGESETLDDISRPEIDALVDRLAAVLPLLPADVRPLVPRLVDPLVRVRAMMQTGMPGTVELGDGKAAVPEIFDRCATYVSNYDDGPGGAGD